MYTISCLVIVVGVILGAAQAVLGEELLNEDQKILLTDIQKAYKRADVVYLEEVDRITTYKESEKAQSPRPGRVVFGHLALDVRMQMAGKGKSVLGISLTLQIRNGQVIALRSSNRVVEIPVSTVKTYLATWCEKEGVQPRVVLRKIP